MGSEWNKMNGFNFRYFIFVVIMIFCFLHIPEVISKPLFSFPLFSFACLYWAVRWLADSVFYEDMLSAVTLLENDGGLHYHIKWHVRKREENLIFILQDCWPLSDDNNDVTFHFHEWMHEMRRFTILHYSRSQPLFALDAYFSSSKQIEAHG